MADVRVAPNVVISDPDTPSQIAKVDAAGLLQVDIAALSATFAVDTELPTAAALSDNFANPTAPGVGAFAMVWDGATWDRAPGTAADGLLVNLGANNDVTVTSGAITADTELPAAASLTDNFANPTAPAVGAFNMVWDGSTWDRAPGTSTDGLLVNLGANNDVTVTSGTVTIGDGTDNVDVETAGADNLANTLNQLITGAFLYGYDGSTWDRIYAVADGDAVAAGTKGFLVFGTDGSNYQALATDAQGNLQVDVLSGGGADTPTNPVSSYDTTSAVAAGATDNHDTTDFGAATKKVSQVIFGASVPLKVELQYVDNGSATTLAVGFSAAGETETLKPTHRNYWSHTFTANAGFDGFRVIRTNLDPSEAADVYSTIMYED